METRQRISHSDLLELKRWNTPTIYNGWEQITRRNAGHECFNLEEVHDFMPQMGPMVGWAITLVVEPGNPTHKVNGAALWSEYRRYIASVPGPKIVVVQDLDKPNVFGSFWGEVTSNTHRALGCVGTITDGAIRDVDEMTNAGLKAIARRMCVGHAFSAPVRWGCEVEVFGTRVQPGDLIHGDKHGFLAIPQEDQVALLDAARFMDSNECQTVIQAARSSAGKTKEEILQNLDEAAELFRKRTREKFHPK
jgi:4-hydroxy-4-methyl-2-oxoglutarate aldolase